MYYVYIIRNKITGKYYIGQTGNVEKRLFKHNTGQADYTKKGKGLWELVHYESFASKKESLEKENKIKGRGSGRYLDAL